MTDLHPDITALAFLVGTWEGAGEGEYPTIEPFAYRERVTFSHVGKPFLRYEQRTADPETAAPMHAEVGYLRLLAAGHVELVLAQPNGVAEVHSGSLTATALELASTTVALTGTAKRVDAVERSLAVEGDRLSYTLRMAAVGEAMTHHLAATLHRVES